VQNLAANVIFAGPLYFLAPDGHHPAADPDFSMTHDLCRAAIAMVVIAPVFETLFLQAAPIELARALRQSRWIQFLFGVIPFAVLHFPMGIKVGIAAGTVPGMFLSHAYLEGRTCSVWSAFWITMVIHAIHNLICVGILFLSSGVVLNKRNRC
jgi:membrane protease YdiL (CAAX protease family)